MKDYLNQLLFDAARRFVPFKDWIGELKNPEVLRADIFAGITVALVLIPQSMANAQLAGLPPQIGSSRQLQNGPVAIISLMTAAALIPLNLEPSQYIAYAAMIAIMAGVMQLILGFLRLGMMVDFLSHPVVIGFINAAAIVISSLQLSKLLGIENVTGSHLYETLWNLLKAIPTQTHLPTLAMGLFSMALLYCFKKFLPKLPGILFTVVTATVLAWLLNFEGMGGKVVGKIESGLPSFVMPTMDPRDITSLKTRQHLSANQEMVGKGLANVVAGVTQGYAVSGSFSRTAVAFDAGAKTGMTAIISGIIVGVTLLFLTPLLYHLPVATLAAVIIMAVIGMIHFEPFKHACRFRCVCRYIDFRTTSGVGYFHGCDTVAAVLYL